MGRQEGSPVGKIVCCLLSYKGQVEEKLVITGTAAGHAATTLSNPHYTTPKGLHSLLYALKVIYTHREGYR